MTFYELLCEAQHRECDLAESYLADMIALESIDMLSPAKKMVCKIGIKDHIDRAYVLGEIIDNLPVELAEREV